MLNYSISLSQTPGSVTKKWEAYAHAQVRKTIDINQLADHIAGHKSNYDRADVCAVLYKAVACLKELVLDGCKVELGELGSFYASLKSEGADFPNEFTSSNIQKVTVNWERGPMFANMRSEADFNLVSTRAMQRAGIEAEKNLEQNATSTAGLKTPTFSVTSTPVEGQELFGTIQGRGIYSKGSTATVTAVPAKGFLFSSWDDGVASATRTATENFSAKAKFERQTGGTTVVDPSAD